MHLHRWIVMAALLSAPAFAAADEAKDPLRFVPAQADVVVKIERPRALLQILEKDDLVADAKKLAAVRDVLDSTNLRQLEQLIAYFEKSLGADKYELLDLVAGGGIVLAGKIENPAGALAVVQARDDKRLKQLVEHALRLADAERERLEVKEPIRKTDYKGVPTIAFGDASAALVDGALLIASKKEILKGVLDHHLAAHPPIGTVAAFQEARAALPAGAHVWGWLNLDTVKKQPGFKAGFDAATQDPFLMLLFGGFTDVIKRSTYATAFLQHDGHELRLGVRMPAGRDGMSAISKLVIPERDGGTLPMLKTSRSYASFSYFLDLGQLWEHRRKIFNDKQADAMDKAEQEFAKVALGIKLGTLLQQMGNHHRVVVAAPEKMPYASKAYAEIPAFAVVIDVRDPQFSKTINLAVRAGGFAAVLASKGSAALSEKEHAGHKLVCLSFVEGKALEGDPTGLRFNYSPCFAMVGDQLLFSSTLGLGKEMIDELSRPSAEKPQPATSRARLDLAATAVPLGERPESVMTQLILAQSLSPAAARDEVRRLVALTEKLGAVNLAIHYGARDFRFDVRWQRDKDSP
jgi:hypothetical protein